MQKEIYFSVKASQSSPRMANHQLDSMALILPRFILFPLGGFFFSPSIFQCDGITNRKGICLLLFVITMIRERLRHLLTIHSTTSTLVLKCLTSVLSLPLTTL